MKENLKNQINALEQRSKIRLPKNLREWIIENPNEDDILLVRLNQLIAEKGKIKPQSEISEEFAKRIYLNYKALSSDDIKKIRLYDKEGFLKQYADELEYLLIEGVSFYSHDEDKFHHPILEPIYNERNGDEWIINTWVLDMDCGGFSGVILNTEEKGCFSLGSYGNFESINIDEKYQYYKYKRLGGQGMQYSNLIEIKKDKKSISTATNNG